MSVCLVGYCVYQNNVVYIVVVLESETFSDNRIWNESIIDF